MHICIVLIMMRMSSSLLEAKRIRARKMSNLGGDSAGMRIRVVLIRKWIRVILSLSKLLHMSGLGADNGCGSFFIRLDAAKKSSGKASNGSGVDYIDGFGAVKDGRVAEMMKEDFIEGLKRGAMEAIDNVELSGVMLKETANASNKGLGIAGGASDGSAGVAVAGVQKKTNLDFVIGLQILDETIIAIGKLKMSAELRKLFNKLWQKNRAFP